MTLVFDIETDGLLLEATVVNCIVAYCIEERKMYTYDVHNIKEGIEKLESATHLVGHNIIGYDIPVLARLWGFNSKDISTTDTLLLAKLVYYNKDKSWSHSLDAYGERLGFPKGKFSDWKAGYSQELLDYCIQDVRVTNKLLQHLNRKRTWLPDEALELEQDVQKIVVQQYINGWKFNEEKARLLHIELVGELEEAEEELYRTFKPLYLPEGKSKIPKKPFTRLGIHTMGEHQPIKLMDFNPGSGAHIVWWVHTLYGGQQWKFPSKEEVAKRDREARAKGKPIRREPTVFSGILLGHPDNAKTDSDTLVEMFSSYAWAKPLLHYLEVKKLLGQLAEGDKAWLKLVRKDGRIHGGADILGAVTGRFTHSTPNLAQVPSVRAYKGVESRSLFTVESGYKLVGADASGLELRTLSHYLGRYDGGLYGNTVLEGDIHSANQESAGLPTRDMAKTFIYGFLYGAGDGKIGQIVGGTSKEGKQLKSKFLKRTMGLQNLIGAVKVQAKRGYLRGISGRRLYIRSPHSALNVLLQSAGAYYMKYWVVAVDKMITTEGYDAKMVGNIHDEIQVEVREDQAEEFAKKLEALFISVGEDIGMRIKMEGESRVGDNWMETH